MLYIFIILNALGLLIQLHLNEISTLLEHLDCFECGLSKNYHHSEQ